MTTAMHQSSDRREGRPEAIVDVGIPACGRPRFLVDAIESILAQSLTSWRLRISEDGPPGGAVEEAVRPYLADPRVSYSATGRQLGAAGNSTQVIQAGSAPYVHLIHDDDVIEGGFLERHVSFLEANPSCGVAFSMYGEIDQEGREIAHHDPELREGVLRVEDCVRLMLHHNALSPHCAVVRRSAYEAVGSVFDASFPWAYDYEMWFRLATRVPFGYLPVCDAYWRRHGEQITYNVDRGEEYLKLLDHTDEWLQRELPDARLGDKVLRRKRASAMLSASLDALQQGDRAKAGRHLRQALGVSKLHLLDPRVPLVLGGIAFGAPGTRLAVACRRFFHRHGRRLVYSPYPSLPPRMDQPAGPNSNATTLRAPAPSQS
jgi:glycosyltransferase involved in cell wall biosynthesis